MGTQLGYLKGKLGLRGKTKPGEMISRMNSMKKLTMKEWEGSPMDRRLDKKLGYKEGSKEDNKADRKALARYNKGRKITKKII